jgi:hypothetical protein
MLAGLALLASSATGSARASGKTRLHGFVLTELAGTGTVYWRAHCPSEYSLGFHVPFSTGTTTIVAFRWGHRVLRRTVQPGHSTWSPFRKTRRQSLSTGTAHEAETIIAKVAVHFNEPHSLFNCFPYAPPRLSVTLYGREH